MKIQTGSALLLAILAMACQPPQQGVPDAGPGVGTTTYSRGAEVTRSETTRTVEPAPDEVTLALDRSAYAPGARVVMTVRSQSRDTLGYNQCGSRTVERQQGTGWSAVAEPGRMCTMELRLLLPGEVQTATTDLPRDLTTGTYRMVLTLSRQTAGASGSVRAASASFRVE